MISSLTLGASPVLPGLEMAGSSGPAPLTASKTGAFGSFTDVLAGYVSSATNTLKSAEAGAAAGIQGKIPMQTMVDQILTAERTLQAAIAVRDKVVSSYLEISRMSI